MYSNPSVIRNYLLHVLKFAGDLGDTVELEASLFRIYDISFHFESIFKHRDKINLKIHTQSTLQLEAIILLILNPVAET